MYLKGHVDYIVQSLYVPIVLTDLNYPGEKSLCRYENQREMLQAFRTPVLYTHCKVSINSFSEARPEMRRQSS